MEEKVVPDQQKTEEFVDKMLGVVSASMTVMLAAIGDRLGLFKDLAEGGPATSQELATRTDINERYAREWLGAMSSASYLQYAPLLNRVGGRVTPAVLPHHRAYGSVPRRFAKKTETDAAPSAATRDPTSRWTPLPSA